MPIRLQRWKLSGNSQPYREKWNLLLTQGRIIGMIAHPALDVREGYADFPKSDIPDASKMTPPNDRAGSCLRAIRGPLL